MRYTKMRKMIRQMAAGALTAFLLIGLTGCGAAGIAGPVTEEETDEQETGSAVDVGEQGVSDCLLYTSRIWQYFAGQRCLRSL